MALSVSLVDWLAGQGGQLQSGMQTISQWPLPPWTSLWLDPAWMEALRASMVWTVEVFAAWTPWIAPVLDWIAPILWGIWALGMAGLVVLAGLGLWLVGRLRRPRPQARYAA